MNSLSTRLSSVIPIVAFLAAGWLLPGTDVRENPGFPFQDQAGFQSGPREGSLTLEACVRIALDENPSLQAAREGAASAREGAGMAKASYYPSLSLDAGYRRWESHAFLPSSLTGMGIRPVIGPIDDWSAGLKAGYVLFDSGERAARMRSALALRDLAEEEAERIRQDIALAVHQAFYNLLAAREAESVARKNLERAESHLKLAEEFYAAGAVPQADVVRARVETADGKLQLVRTSGKVGIALGRLNLAMGLPVESKIDIVPEPGEIKSPEQMNPEEILALAIDRRPEIRAVVNKKESAESSVAAAKSSFGPDVTANVAYGFRDSDFVPGDRDWAVGISVNLPLFQGFRRTHELAQARREAAKQEAEIHAVKLRIREEAWSALLSFREYYQAVKASEAVLLDAEESMRMIRERYQAGAATATDLLDAQTTLARAEYVKQEAHYSCLAAQSLLQRATGTILD